MPKDEGFPKLPVLVYSLVYPQRNLQFPFQKTTVDLGRLPAQRSAERRFWQVLWVGGTTIYNYVLNANVASNYAKKKKKQNVYHTLFLFCMVFKGMDGYFHQRCKKIAIDTMIIWELSSAF